MEYADFTLEVKALEGRQFEGHGSVFGNVDLGGDIVVPGAFKRSLAQHKAAGTLPLMFWMHKPDEVPGLWLKMDEDAQGLAVRGDLVETQLGNEVHQLLKRKAVRGLSIGYSIEDVGWSKEGHRLLKQVNLWEVSVVSMAMNPLARVDAAKTRLSQDGEYVPTLREMERRLHGAGFSKAVARSLVGRIFGAPGGMPDGPRWDAGEEEDLDEKGVIDALDRLADKIGAQALQR